MCAKTLPVVALFAACSTVAAEPATKAVRDLDRAVRKTTEKTARDARLNKPGTRNLPQGKGEHLQDFPAERIRARDLGLSLANQQPGVTVEQLDPRSPWAEYGLRDGDRIVQVDGKPVRKEREFIDRLFAEKVRSGRVAVTIVRGQDESRDLVVSPAVLLEAINPGLNDLFHRLGVSLGDRSGNELRVTDVEPQTVAAEGGVRRGDVLVSFDGQEVETAQDLADLVRDAKAGSYVVEVQREATVKKLTLKLK